MSDTLRVEEVSGLIREARSVCRNMVGSRDTAMVITKLDEAEMWLSRHHLEYIPGERTPELSINTQKPSDS